MIKSKFRMVVISYRQGGDRIRKACKGMLNLFKRLLYFNLRNWLAVYYVILYSILIFCVGGFFFPQCIILKRVRHRN